MRIGILTFHWATNYGAILQAYCLQEHIRNQGHQVTIVYYKPRKFEFSWLRIIKHPRLWKGVPRALASRKKEKLLVPFRDKYLKTTNRYYSVNEFGEEIDKFDIFISGSDQVLNPGFTLSGEDGRPSPVYWLGFGSKAAKRLGYAVSFGYEVYPEKAVPVVKPWINGFDVIGVREKSGLQILEQLGYNGPCEILPDPTLLLGKNIFETLGLEMPLKRNDYICVYMLRREVSIKCKDVRYIDEKHHPLTMEEWLKSIMNAGALITNSYHGMIVGLLSHVPFAVLLETEVSCGMNDRFRTLLDRIGLSDHMTTTVENALNIIRQPVDYNEVDLAINNYRMIGVDFLARNIRPNNEG